MTNPKPLFCLSQVNGCVLHKQGLFLERCGELHDPHFRPQVLQDLSGVQDFHCFFASVFILFLVA
jgi:hypothetical protein